MGVRITSEYSYMKCLYNKPNFTSKNGLKMHKNRFYRHAKFKNFLGGDPPNPPYERGYDPLSCPPPPARAFGPRGTPMAFNSRTTFPKPTTALTTHCFRKRRQQCKTFIVCKYGCVLVMYKPTSFLFAHVCERFFFFILETCPCNEHPLTPNFYLGRLGFTRVLDYFLIFALKHRSWVLVRTASARRFKRVPTIYVLSKNKINITFFIGKLPFLQS